MSKSKASKENSSPQITPEDINKILYADTSDPHSILGMHFVNNRFIVRVFDPVADKVELICDNDTVEMQKIDSNGFFVYSSDNELSGYQLSRHYGTTVCTEHDCYSFLPAVGDLDLHLFGIGDHHELYNLLGSRIMEINSVKGTRFTVWAPNAARVSVIGNFNSWDGRRHIMRSLGNSGIWEIFIPRLDEGEYYKYEIKDSNGHIFTKQDPLSQQYERRPGTASVVSYDTDFEWHDDEWIARRSSTDPLKSPLSIYEVHLHSWNGPGLPDKNGREFYNYRELAVALCDYVKEMGFTHIELMPVTEHPLDQSWGYQTTGYFAPTSRFGDLEDFAWFVNHFHCNGIGIIIDWAPAHFPKDTTALGRFDGTALYEHLDPRLGEHQDWGTFIFNYGRREVANFLVASALFWLKEFHIDGLRVDAVSSMLYLDYSREHDQWIPNEHGGNENLAAIEFIKKLNSLAHEKYPGVMIIAEESTAYTKVSKPVFDGGLGYTMKWNMGWMHDFLEYFKLECIHRKYHQNQITFSLTYAFNENFILPLSHDEVVHGKGSLLTRMPGDIWQKFANLRCLFGIMFSHPGRKLLFMGSELAQWREWNCDGSLDWPTLSNPLHSGIKNLIQRLNEVYTQNSCFWENDHKYESFEWVDFSDNDQSVVSFIRYNLSKDNMILCVCNLTPVVRDNYQIGVPCEGKWKVLINSDDKHFGGNQYLQSGEFQTTAGEIHGRHHYIELSLPPLSVIYLQPQP